MGEGRPRKATVGLAAALENAETDTPIHEILKSATYWRCTSCGSRKGTPPHDRSCSSCGGTSFEKEGPIDG